jgi:HEPN domain
VISIEELVAIAQARLEDANVLFENGRADGAGYLCGYAVELALKARICRTLNWQGFPEKRSEFENFASFKTHKLEVLLTLSGQEQRIKTENLSEWSAVVTWDPEARYRAIGQADTVQVALMIVAAETLLKVL